MDGDEDERRWFQAQLPGGKTNFKLRVVKCPPPPKHHMLMLFATTPSLGHGRGEQEEEP